MNNFKSAKKINRFFQWSF